MDSDVFGAGKFPAFDFRSMMAFAIRPHFNEVCLGVGTGFLYQAADRTCLVTNWHNVTGRDPTTLEVIHSRAALPNRLEITPHFTVSGGNAGQIGHRLATFFLPLYEEAEMTEPKWLEHRRFGRKVDVAAIPLSESDVPGELELSVLSRGETLLRVSVGMDALILGYPRGLSGGRFPIWKRGSIASEPYEDLDDLPKLYIDSATREGMSGSPVFACSNGIVHLEGVRQSGVANGIVHRLIGVYSGRVGNDQLGAQLGIVWKECALVEIIEDGVVGVASGALTPLSHR